MESPFIDIRHNELRLSRCKSVRYLPCGDAVCRHEHRRIVRRIYARCKLETEIESVYAIAFERIDYVRSAEPVVLVGIRDAVTVEVGERCLHGGVWIGTVNKTIVVAITHGGICSRRNLDIIRNAVKV